MQLSAAVVYEAVRPIPPPVLWISVEASSDTATGGVLVHVLDTDETLRCFPGQPCRVEVPRGLGSGEVTVDAIPGPNTTFDGWDGCTPIDQDDVLRCHFSVRKNTAVGVYFGDVPDEVNVAMIDVPSPPDEIALPPPIPAPDEIAPKKPKTPEEIEAEKLEDQAVEVAIVKPIPPKQLPMPQPPQPPEEKKAPPPIPENMTMVEVPDENEVKDAPDDATHLSDKNRDVAEETRATETNLEKEHKGESVASEESDVQSEEVGGKEDTIHQMEDSEPTTAERVETTTESGASDKAVGVVTGDEGEAGDEGKGETKDPGMLAMRGIEGRGNVVENGDGKKKGKKGDKGVKTQLEFEDYERIVGKDKAEKERAVARREQSHKKGRYQKKLEAIKSALENFTPDVRPGNQTALKTRASPFAVFIARMHRRIHELWGFGWLEDLDKKSADHPLNNFDLFASIEVVINPDGSVYKMTIAKTSGILEYDVAALHTIEAASPFGQTPEKIRSVDERVYLRWGFYRNWRQCGTFNVEPYILTDIPGGVVPLPEDMDTSDGSTVATADDAVGGEEVETPASIARGTKTVTPEPSKGSGAAGGDETSDHVKAADANTEATYAANMWVAGFSTVSYDRMLKVSSTPFYAGSELAASNQKELRSVYEALIVESGALRSWELMTADQYTKQMGVPVEVAEGSLVLLVAAKEVFAIVLVPTKSGQYRATSVIR
jgi:TonB family protein